MRRTAIILSLAGMVAFSACSEDNSPYAVPCGPDCSDYVARAKELFQAVPRATRSSEDEPFTMTPGDSEVDWDASDSYVNKNAGISGIEADIRPSYHYRVVMPDGKVVQCAEELLYARDDETGNDDIFMVYYVPEPDDETGKGLDICKSLDNSGDMSGYSGLKIYTSMDGYLVGVVKYKDGACKEGVHFPSLQTEDDMYAGLVAFIGMMGGMRIERVIYSGGTKAEEGYYGGEIEAAICVASYDVPDINYITLNNFYQDGSWLESRARSIIGGSGGGSTVNPIGMGNGGKSSTGIFKEEDLEKDREVNLAELKKKICDMIKNNGVTSNTIKYFNDWVAKTLGENPDAKMLIYVWDSVTNGKGLVSVVIYTGSGLEEMNKTVYIPHDQVKNTTGICEEMFHAYQRMDASGWSTGDLELEAKAYNCYLAADFGTKVYEDLKNYYGGDNVEAFESFYRNPCELTFNAAVEALRTVQNGMYNETDFPVSGVGNGSTFMDYSDKVKHLNRFKKVINEIEN